MRARHRRPDLPDGSETEETQTPHLLVIARPPPLTPSRFGVDPGGVLTDGPRVITSTGKRLGLYDDASSKVSGGCAERAQPRPRRPVLDYPVCADVVSWRAFVCRNAHGFRQNRLNDGTTGFAERRPNAAVEPHNPWRDALPKAYVASPSGHVVRRWRGRETRETAARQTDRVT